MLPVTLVNNYTPTQVPLVNTTLPGSAATHVPYDNVAPSISNAQVNNNASPNSEAAAAEQTDSSSSAGSSEEQTAALANTATQSTSMGAQAPFLAQLMSQDGSPVTQVILVQYEKLLALGNTKYKPSNAFKPTSEPSTVFGKILQDNKSTAVSPSENPEPVAQPRVSAPAPTPTASQTFTAAPAPQPTPAPITTTSASTNVSNAYTATAARVNTQQLAPVTELA